MDMDQSCVSYNVVVVVVGRDKRIQVYDIQQKPNIYDDDDVLFIDSNVFCIFVVVVVVVVVPKKFGFITYWGEVVSLSLCIFFCFFLHRIISNL
jgi:hypothetical protein